VIESAEQEGCELKLNRFLFHLLWRSVARRYRCTVELGLSRGDEAAMR